MTSFLYPSSISFNNGGMFEQCGSAMINELQILFILYSCIELIKVENNKEVSAKVFPDQLFPEMPQ